MQIGIDLGGTKIEIAVLEKNREVIRRRVPTPAGDYDATVESIVRLVLATERELGAAPRPLGIGGPGAISRVTGCIKNANSTMLNGRPLPADLAQRLERQVRFANDANCLALSEATDGAAAGAPVVFGIILGTGVGGGIVAGGSLLEGPNAIAGEWGHTPLPWPRDDERPGPRCYCGRFGCLETFLSGPHFARDDARTGPARSAQEIVAAAAAGEARALASFERYLDRLSRGLATAIDILDPDVVVLGGGLSNVERIRSELPARIGTYAFSDRLDTRFERALHGDSSGVRGAARLWPDSV